MISTGKINAIGFLPSCFHPEDTQLTTS